MCAEFQSNYRVIPLPPLTCVVTLKKGGNSFVVVDGIVEANDPGGGVWEWGVGGVVGACSRRRSMYGVRSFPSERLLASRRRWVNNESPRVSGAQNLLIDDAVRRNLHFRLTHSVMPIVDKGMEAPE